MFNWNDYLTEDQRRQDERAAAAAWRREQHVMRDGQGNQPHVMRDGRKPQMHVMFDNQAGRPHVMRGGRGPRQPVLARFGAQLVEWGCKLQARYAHLVEVGDDRPGQTLACNCYI